MLEQLFREDVMASPKIELVGANDAVVKVGAEPVSTLVRVDHSAAIEMQRNFKTFSTIPPTREPARYFLNLESIRGANDAAILYVYVDIPGDGAKVNQPEQLAGVVSLFGVGMASRPESGHAGNGVSESLEITSIVDALDLSDPISSDRFEVRIVPATPVHGSDQITVDRVSIYRQTN